VGETLAQTTRPHVCASQPGSKKHASYKKEKVRRDWQTRFFFCLQGEKKKKNPEKAKSRGKENIKNTPRPKPFSQPRNLETESPDKIPDPLRKDFGNDPSKKQTNEKKKREGETPGT